MKSFLVESNDSIILFSCIKNNKRQQPHRFVIRRVGGHQPYAVYKEIVRVVNGNWHHDSYQDGRYFTRLEDAKNLFFENIISR